MLKMLCLQLLLLVGYDDVHSLYTHLLPLSVALPADADLEDDMSDDDMPPARPAPVPGSTNRRVRVVPSSRRRPPLAPGTKAAADGGKQKGATTASGRRSFLTLAVSTGEQSERSAFNHVLMAMAVTATGSLVIGRRMSRPGCGGQGLLSVACISCCLLLKLERHAAAVSIDQAVSLLLV
jgi:hypothetical protein